MSDENGVMSQAMIDDLLSGGAAAASPPPAAAAPAAPAAVAVAAPPAATAVATPAPAADAKPPPGPPHTVVPKLITTGNMEVDKKIGGGLPIGSLTLIEGTSDSGKSVLTQQFIWGCLEGGLKIAVYTSENTAPSLLRQMDSLSLHILDFFLLARINIYVVPNSFPDDGRNLFDLLLEHMTKLEDVDLFIVDSLTALITHSTEADTLGFFAKAKRICDASKTLLLTMHSYAIDGQLLTRLRSLCDAHLSLRTEEVGDRLVKVLEVSKVRGASKTTGNIVSFDVEPNLGMRIIPVTKAKA